MHISSLPPDLMANTVQNIITSRFFNKEGLPHA